MTIKKITSKVLASALVLWLLQTLACIINSMACIINSTVFSHSNKFFRQILSLTVGFSHWLSHRGCWAPILTGTSRGICAKLLINVWGQGWLIRAEYESAKNSLVTCFRFNISSKLESVDVPSPCSGTLAVPLVFHAVSSQPDLAVSLQSLLILSRTSENRRSIRAIPWSWRYRTVEPDHSRISWRRTTGMFPTPTTVSASFLLMVT